MSLNCIFIYIPECEKLNFSTFIENVKLNNACGFMTSTVGRKLKQVVPTQDTYGMLVLSILYMTQLDVIP